MTDKPPLLKDMIDRSAVGSLARAVAAESELEEAGFLAEVFSEPWSELALKERIRKVATTLQAHLPGPYPAALAILRAAAPHVEGAGMSAWALCDFVELYGLEDPDLSIPALEQFTLLISAEFAVRPFIERYPERMYAQHAMWADHPDERVRRLASEGIRPRLPWGRALRALRKDPGPIIPVLEKLKDDESETVRRSVANNLNDIAKDHAERVVGLLAQWQDGSDEMAALTKHALRTLLKQGHEGAMGLLGYSHKPRVELSGLSIDPPEAPVGENVHLEFTVTSLASDRQPLMIDYAVLYQNASGKGTRKVFKGTITELDQGQELTVRRRISLVPMSTRTIYPGAHHVEVLVNGMSVASGEFEVLA